MWPALIVLHAFPIGDINLEPLTKLAHGLDLAKPDGHRYCSLGGNGAPPSLPICA